MKSYIIKSFIFGFVKLSLFIGMVGTTVVPSSSAASLDAFSSAWRIQGHLRRHIVIAQKITDRYQSYFKEIQTFYKKRNYRAVWVPEHFNKVAFILDVLRKSDQEGFNPLDYQVPLLENIFKELKTDLSSPSLLNLEKITYFDLLLTEAFFVYTSHLIQGKIDPGHIDKKWTITLRQVDLQGVLKRVLNSKKPQKSLTNLLPKQPGYLRLRTALSRYHQIQSKGGWPKIPAGSILKQGDSHSRIRLLKRRLIVSEDLRAKITGKTNLFNKTLKRAVQRFQRRHGLPQTGIVDQKTLKSLNVPVEARINQLKANMERWRWLPEKLGDRYIIVNIANFQLSVIENKKYVLNMRVMVGRPYRHTPVFHSKMTYLVLNPYWYIPRKLAIEDKLPLIQASPDYLSQHNIQVLIRKNRKLKVIDEDKIDWSQVDENNFNYILRQAPGHSNPLGKVKFIFPNSFSVYLHDTPDPTLFSYLRRDFSSGCIRMEKPFELARYLLQDHPEWTEAHLQTQLEDLITARIQEKKVTLNKSIPVYLLYWTSWVTRKGIVHFRNDIYERDARLIHQLKQS